MNPIRVLQVVYSMDAGGIETMVMNYYRNIDRNKVQFDFLLHCNFKSYYEPEIESLGGKIYRVPSYHPKELLKCKKALKQFFEEHKEYKVVHSHINSYGAYVLSAAKKAGVPVRIAHSHTSGKFYKINATLPFRVYTRIKLKNKYTQLYACSPEAAEFMAPAKPYTIVNNAVDVKRFSFNDNSRIMVRESLNIKDDDFVIGHVGRFSPEKNHEFILAVFEEVLKLKPNSRLLLVGGGKLLEEARNMAADMGISDRIIFAGIRKDIPDLLCAMDAFLFPSKFEGFPVSFVEAQSSDLPCVISDTFSKTSIISDRVQVMSLEKSPEIWAKTLNDIDISLPRRDNSTLMVKAGLDIKSNVEKLQKVYLEAYGHGEQ